ncbi:hypothetical protein [Legionella sp. CNM-4043-24]|uniref:hypothetical protein n=1 Tax=Legionella sp. CNM-4043-24 TaxID=3421646 RepID=UPI00403B325E
MKPLNFIKKNGRAIVSYIFWGLLLTCILPMWTNYILKKYENRAAFNRFLFEQELKPYRNKQIECNHKNLELFKKQAEEIEYWLLVKKIAEKRIRTGKEYLLPKDEHELMFSFIKEANKVNRQISTFSKQVDYCHDESFNYSDEISMMLNITEAYQKISQNYKDDIKKISQNQEIKLKTYLSKINVPFLNNIQDLDLWNNFLIHPEEASISDNKMLTFSVEIRQITFDFATEIYKTRALFHAKTNKLFLNAYQQQLS